MEAIRVILACIRKADKTFNLINENDRIMVGISGGKDSTALFYALTLYKKFSKVNFEIVPCTIDMGFPKMRTTRLKNYIKSLGYDLHIEEAKQVYEILKIQQKEQKLPHLPCSICSKMKKAIINKVAHEFNCNKVAFAHHRDDALETLLMNEIYGGRIATFSPKMHLSNENITFIRPLVTAKENDIKRLCVEKKIPVLAPYCPSDKYTEREEIKNLLKSIYEKYPSSRENFLNMLLNDEQQDIYFSLVENKIEGSPYYYKKVVDQKTLLDYLAFENREIIDNDYKTTKYLLYNDKTVLATLAFSKNINKRSFEIVSYKYKNRDEFSLFIKEIMFNLYEKFNPCTLHLLYKENDLDYFKSLGFNLNNDDLKILLDSLKKCR